jgi:hypothetical protein
MTHGDCDRLEPTDIVARTPILIRPPRLRVFAISGTLLLVPNAILFVVLRLAWEPATYATVATCVLTLWKLGSRTKAYWTKRLELSMFEKLRLNVTNLYGNPGYMTQIGGIKVGAWARRKEEHEAACKDYRRRFGRSANDPLVRYQFVIANFRIAGNQHKVAFSDGSALGSHPLKAVIQQDFNTSLLPKRAEYCDNREVSDTSRALVNLAHVISGNTDTTSLRTLVTSHGLVWDEALLQAIHVASMWGIVCTEGNASALSLYQMVRDSGIMMADLLDSVTLRITDAGRVWQDCSDEAQIARENQRRTRMPQSGSSKIVINNPAGNINVAGQNFYGQTSISTVNRRARRFSMRWR